MANLKLRGERDSVNEKGPSNGPTQSMDIGAEKIDNTAMKGCETKYPSSGPRKQANSSLGAKSVPRPIYGRKA